MGYIIYEQNITQNLFLTQGCQKNNKKEKWINLNKITEKKKLRTKIYQPRTRVRDNSDNEKKVNINQTNK